MVSTVEPNGAASTPAEIPALAGFRHRVRGLLSDRLPPRRKDEPVSVMGAREGAEALVAGRRFLASLEEEGLSTPAWPVEHGGAGLGAAELSVLSEELATFEVPDLYPFSVALGMVGFVVLAHGTAEQQARWLPGIRTGEEIWCQMFSEPDAGSDLAGLSTRAERDGDTWRVTGQKLWTSRAHYSRWGLLLARTDTTVSKHRGITAFAVDMETPGIVLRPLRQINGDEHFNEVFLDDVRIPDRDRIAGVGDGWRVAITTLMHERAGIGGRSAGVTPSHVLGLLARWGAGADSVVVQRAVAILTELDLTKRNAMRARAAEQQGATPGPEGSGGKLLLAATVKRLAGLAMEVQGPYGMLDEGEWQTVFLTAPSISIRGGTDEIQRNIIGERVLGLPGEPRVDKDLSFDETRRVGRDRGAP